MSARTDRHAVRLPSLDAPMGHGTVAADFLTPPRPRSSMDAARRNGGPAWPSDAIRGGPEHPRRLGHGRHAPAGSVMALGPSPGRTGPIDRWSGLAGVMWPPRARWRAGRTSSGRRSGPQSDRKVRTGGAMPGPGRAPVSAPMKVPGPNAGRTYGTRTAHGPASPGRLPRARCLLTFGPGDAQGRFTDLRLIGIASPGSSDVPGFPCIRLQQDLHFGPAGSKLDPARR